MTGSILGIIFTVAVFVCLVNILPSKTQELTGWEVAALVFLVASFVAQGLSVGSRLPPTP